MAAAQTDAPGPIRVDRIDHLVLTVGDIEKTCDFYRRVLGMEVVTFGEGWRALRFGDQKINLHPVGRGFEPKALAPTPGSADICFLTRVPLERVAAPLTTHGVAILEGPVRRTGALGPIESVYLRAPDGNLLEVSNSVAPGG